MCARRRSTWLACAAMAVIAGSLWMQPNQAAEPAKPAGNAAAPKIAAPTGAGNVVTPNVQPTGPASPTAKVAVDPFADEPTPKNGAAEPAMTGPSLAPQTATPQAASPQTAAPQTAVPETTPATPPATTAAPANNSAPANNTNTNNGFGDAPIIPIPGIVQPGPGTAANNTKTPDPFADEPPPAKPNPGTTTTLPNSNPITSPIPNGTIPAPTPGTQPLTTPANTTPSATTLPPTVNPPVDVKIPEGEQTPGQVEFKTGEDLLKAGKYAAALEQFKKAAKLNPEDPPTHFNLGVCYRMLQRLDDAVSEFTKAIRLDPDLGEAYLRRGICWFYKGEYALAILDCDDAASSNLSDPRPFTWKAMALVQQGQLIDAVNTYSLALRYDSHFALAHVNRGLAYYALKDYNRAVADFDEAISVNPGDATLYFKRGVAESAAGNWSAAMASYSAAIRLNPAYAAAYDNRSTVSRQLGDSQRATSDQRKALKLKLAADHGLELPAP